MFKWCFLTIICYLKKLWKYCEIFSLLIITLLLILHLKFWIWSLNQCKIGSNVIIVNAFVLSSSLVVIISHILELNPSCSFQKFQIIGWNELARLGVTFYKLTNFQVDEKKIENLTRNLNGNKITIGALRASPLQAHSNK